MKSAMKPYAEDEKERKGLTKMLITYLNSLIDFIGFLESDKFEKLEEKKYSLIFMSRLLIPAKI
jgi:hypothetical protein